MRFQIFSMNYNKIKVINSAPGITFEIGINFFADMNTEEFKTLISSSNRNYKYDT